MKNSQISLLTPSDVRELANRLGIRPTKTLGQNFVTDAGSVRKIVREAGVEPGDYVLEVGPGLGSLTLSLLEAGAHVSAVEIDPALAAALPHTLAQHGVPDGAFAVTLMDAMQLQGPASLARPALADAVGESGNSQETAADQVGNISGPSKLVANLPYNVAVPIILTVLERFPSIRSALVMVQLEVADRLAARPGSKTYGVPSAKVAWYAEVSRGSKISRNVFWPVPNVDSALVAFTRREGEGLEALPGFDGLADREAVFGVVDAAFAQRRKTLRAALAGWAGSAAHAEEIIRAAGIDPSLRGEKLGIEDFARIAVASTAPSN